MSKHENKQASEQENVQASEQEEKDFQSLAVAAPVNALSQPAKHEGYEVLKNAEGKYIRRAKYEPWASVKPETKQQKIAMMNLLNGGEENANGLRDFIGGEIAIADVIFQPYDSIDEETGELLQGVLTYLITPENVPYVTSSKTVYFTLQRMFQVFGKPHYEGEDVVKVKVISRKGQKHQLIDLKILG